MKTGSISSMINAARVICIATIVYIHVPPFDIFRIDASEWRTSEAAWLFLREFIGRGGVPLLSVISGYLIIRSLQKAPSYWQAIRKRIGTLLAPLVAWNVIALIANLIMGDFQFTGAAQLANSILSIYSPPLIIPTYFLRDLFICALLTILIRPAIEQMGLLAISVITALTIFGLSEFVFINPSIFLFFVVGQFIAIRGIDITQRFAPMPVLMLVLFSCSMLAITKWYDAPLFQGYSAHTLAIIENLITLAQRAAGALVFLRVSLFAAKSNWSRMFDSGSRFSFFFFCAHTMILNGIWIIISRSSYFDLGTPFYWAFFLLSPVIVILFVGPAIWIGRIVAPRVLRVLSGRLGRAERSST